jgi:hypothetical protein
MASSSGTGLEVGPVEDGEIGPGELLLEPAEADLPRHHSRLGRLRPPVARAGELPVVDARTRRAVRLQRLVVTTGVVADHRVGRVQDPLRGAVVPLERHEPGIRVVALEVEDVAYVCPPPGVDRLVVVSHHAEVAAGAGEEACHLELGRVGVLVLVHQQVVPAPPAGVACLGVVPEEAHRQQQEVVEVADAGRPQRLLVARVHVGGEHLVVVVPGALLRRGDHLGTRLLRRHHAALPVRDARQDALRIVALLPVGRRHDAHLLREDPAYGGNLVAGGVDGEVRLDPDRLAMAAEDPGADRVEGGQGDAPGRLRRERTDALPHLVGRPVGEGHPRMRRGETP